MHRYIDRRHNARTYAENDIYLYLNNTGWNSQFFRRCFFIIYIFLSLAR